MKLFLRLHEKSVVGWMDPMMWKFLHVSGIEEAGPRDLTFVSNLNTRHMEQTKAEAILLQRPPFRPGNPHVQQTIPLRLHMLGNLIPPHFSRSRHPSHGHHR